MAKLKNPLLSLGAVNTIGGVLTFTRRRLTNIAQSKPEPFDAQTALQLDWRHMFLKVVALWNALTPSEKHEWESLARRRHLTGYQWFVSQALKPNPGIYLPLQGGTMSGDIDMAKNRLLSLPLPTVDQEPASKKYHDDNLPAGPYTQGARVTRTTSVAIPNSTWTTILFNVVRWDTDVIFNLPAYPDRLTCKTPGVYYVSLNVRFQTHATGYRYAGIFHNAWPPVAVTSLLASAGMEAYLNASTCWSMALNDWVELKVWQNSGAPLDLYAVGNYTPEFMMQRIG